jgi:hypothetical protein
MRCTEVKIHRKKSEEEEAQDKAERKEGYVPVVLSMTRMKSSETAACQLPLQPLEGRRCTLSGIL